MKNNTSKFISIIDQTTKENYEYFSHLEKIATEDIQQLKVKILNDLSVPYENPHFDLSKIFQNNIKEFILNRKPDFSMDTKEIENISTQIEIDFLLKKCPKEKSKFYYSISHALIYYGIYRDKKIVSFQDIKFWKELVKKIILLNLMNPSQYTLCCDNDYYNSHLDFNKLPRLIEAKTNIEEKLNEEIDIIDSVVVFKKDQEERIVKKIEEKLSRLHLFNFLRFIFNLYQDDKLNNNIEHTIPYKYVINILVKNIYKSKHKINNKKKIANALTLLISFISLYQLKEDKFKAMNISKHSLVEHLRKQVLYANFYPIYSLKTNTLTEYVEQIIKPSVDEELFLKRFGFDIKDLIDFFKLLDQQADDIVTFRKGNLKNNELKILDFFSINANQVNCNYSTINNLKNNSGIFAMNPIIKYKNEYFIIGYKYLKLNFYNSLVEKIRTKFDKKINQKIGSIVDIFVEKIFTEIKSKHGYDVFSGNYRPPKKENPESDLILKLEKDIIFIENKNKYLTSLSFSGSDSSILKDFVLSFAFSQKQLFKHEINLRNYKKIKFTKDNRELKYSDENIVKISISTNNWFNIMNNIPQTMLLSLIGLRFSTEEDEHHKNNRDYVKANKYLDELENVVSMLDQNKEYNMRIILNQTLFLPLELIVDKYKDDNFIECLKTLVGMKMNTDNILNIYDYCQYLNTHNQTKIKST